MSRVGTAGGGGRQCPEVLMLSKERWTHPLTSAEDACCDLEGKC